MGLLRWTLIVPLLFLPFAVQATVVRLQTTLGIVDIVLLDSEAPSTVANFLTYVQSAAYNNSFIHRNIPGFVVQGGGFVWDSVAGAKAIATLAPIANEFSATRSNQRGTVAMAKVGSNPDSATSQWFVNLADNSANLDNQNGGFSVFGRIGSNGMAVIDAISALKTVNAGGVFTNLPVTSVPSSGKITGAQLASIVSAIVLPSGEMVADSERLFNYLEAAYPQYVAPASQPTSDSTGYTYRYYPATNSYVATASGVVYYLGPVSGNSIVTLGALNDLFVLAAQAGY